MRPRLATYVAALAATLLLAACNGDREPPTAPVVSLDPFPIVNLAARRSAPLDPSHKYEFSFACSGAAESNSSVLIKTDTPIPRLYIACNSSSGLGMEYGTAFNTFGFEILLDSLNLNKTCELPAVTTTGTFKCRTHKFSGTLTVTDQGT